MMLSFLRHFPVLKNTFFCDIEWLGEGKGSYKLASSGAYFVFTFVIVKILYMLIYCRLRNR